MQIEERPLVENDFAERKKWTDRTVPIAALGLIQRQMTGNALGKALDENGCDGKVYCFRSAHKRVEQSWDGIKPELAGKHIVEQVDPRLGEINQGAYWDKSYAERARMVSGHWIASKHRQHKEHPVMWWSHKPPDGESAEEMNFYRIRPFLNELRRTFPPEREDKNTHIVVVSHDYPIRNIRMALQNETPDWMRASQKPGPGSIWLMTGEWKGFEDKGCIYQSPRFEKMVSKGQIAL